MEYYVAERKKELLLFTTAWMELESILLSEVSQAVRDKYHMISPIINKSTKQTSKQNRTRDMGIKNKLTVTRREAGGDNRGKRGKGHQGTCIRDTWTKPKAGGFEGGRWGWLGCVGVVGEKQRQLY